MPKGKPPVYPTESELRGALDVLRHEAAHPRLRQLLAAGQDTAALRGEMVALERRIEDIAAALAALATDREREEAANTSADAAALATDAVARLEARLADLQPPHHPTTKGTDQ
jgi:hypothetical protein